MTRLIIVFSLAGALGCTTSAAPSSSTSPRASVAAAEPPAAPAAPEAPPAPPPEPEPEPPAEVVAVAAVTPPPPPAPPRVQTILVIGDSMAATDYGKQLQKRLNRHPLVKCRRRGKSATGLARPDYFDWMKEARRRVKQHDPDVVVVVIGGNDGQDLIDAAGQKRRVIWKTKGWPGEYAARLEAFVEVLKGEDRRVVWLELPAMDRPHLEGKLADIRLVQEQTLARLDRVTYVPTRPLFYDAKGNLRRRVKVKGYRAAQALRQDDGIHFTVPGAKYFADGTVEAVLEAAGVKEPSS